MKPIHGAPVPFHVQHQLSETPPIPCGFKLGDRVIFTNDAGLRFERQVRGFDRQISGSAYKGFIYIFEDSSSWWFPVEPSTLELITPETSNRL